LLHLQHILATRNLISFQGLTEVTDAHETEAACLLRTGALYRTRAGLLPPRDGSDLVFVGFKKGAFSIYFGDAPIYHFDLEGRWQRAYIEPTHYLKSLDTTVQAIDRVREGANLVLRRRTLEDAEAAELDLQVRGIALGLIGELESSRVRRQEPPEGKAVPLGDEELRAFLARIVAWDDAAWQAHRTRYRVTYGPLPFLPPECQNAVVLQATMGNSGGRSFGQGPVSTHSVRSPAEFEEHANDVVRLMGRRLLQTRVAFLAGSDVLRRPAQDVTAYLETLGRMFQFDSASKASPTSPDDDSPCLEGVHVFLDDFSSPRPDRELLAACRARHLLHVSLGVESGDPAVRESYKKTWKDDELRALVSDLKACDLRVSVLTLVDAGGAGHVKQTSDLLTSLELARGDTVFLLDEKEVRDPAADLGEEGSLTGAEWAEQQQALRLALTPLRERGVKVLPYSLDKQWG
jgi:hypothetical protein